MAENKDIKKGTLSLGTLGVASKPAARKTGVAVEVKKRRSVSASAQSVSAADVDENSEMGRRLKVLEEAKKNADIEQKKREEERKQAQDLARGHSEKQAEVVAKKAEEAAKKAEEEAQRLEEELKAEREAQAVEANAIAEAQAAQEKAPARGKGHEAPSHKKKEKAASGRPADRDQGKKKGGRNAYMEQLEQRYRTMGPRKGRKKSNQPQIQQEPQEKVTREVVIPEVITVQELANRMAEKVSDLIKNLMMMGQMVTQNQSIDQETAALIVEEFGHTYKFVSEGDIEEGLVEEESDETTSVVRPPVVTVMGHVDHGKTSLLDALRRTDVAAGEAGGITQHIGAYQITTEGGQPITFLDTPGHEAFTSMRARGASLTDIVILVVAADDGVMPQTIEAIRHAKAAEVPIIVAVNKCDKPEANPDRVKQELLTHDLVPEEFGGDIACMHISAKAGTGLEELEEQILLQAEMLELKANPERRADGIVVESRLDKGRGPVATVVINNGTLRVGDVFVAGSVWGRVRALTDDKGRKIESAGPAFPVEVQGLQAVCDAGESFVQTKDDRRAREVAEYRDRKKREKAQASARGRMSLDNLFNRIAEGETQKLGVVVKADVQGSVEAIEDALAKLSTEEVKVSVIHGAVGVITENDVNLASASDALILGFNVRANPQARSASEREGIEMRYYSVIYNLVDDVKAALTGLLESEYEEKVTGRAEIRQVMTINKIKISGSYVTEGKLARGGKIRIIRDGVVVHDGELASLRRFKDEVKEVAENYECGLTFLNYDDVRDGDEIEAYEMVEIKRSLEDVKKAEKAKAEAAKAAKEEAELARMLEEEAGA